MLDDYDNLPDEGAHPGFADVQCPSCFEVFQVAAPAPAECPTEWDYDCEVCCRPLFIRFEESEGTVYAEARGIND